MPRPRQPIKEAGFFTVPDDPLDQKAWDYLKKVSTGKKMHPMLGKELCFADAIKYLANQFKSSQFAREHFAKKKQVNQFIDALRKTSVKLESVLADGKTSSKLEKQLADLLVEDQDLRSGLVMPFVAGWGIESTVFWELRKCLYTYYSDKARRICGLEITETDPLLLRKRLKRNLKKLPPIINVIVERINSHPVYRRARKPTDYHAGFYLDYVADVFKLYGLTIWYVEHKMEKVPVFKQESYLDYGHRDRYHKSEYFRCVQIVLEHGHFYIGTTIKSLLKRCKQFNKDNQPPAK